MTEICFEQDTWHDILVYLIIASNGITDNLYDNGKSKVGCAVTASASGVPTLGAILETNIKNISLCLIVIF